MSKELIDHDHSVCAIGIDTTRSDRSDIQDSAGSRYPSRDLVVPSIVCDAVGHMRLVSLDIRYDPLSQSLRGFAGEYLDQETGCGQPFFQYRDLRSSQGVDDQLLLLDFGFSLDNWFLVIVWVLLFANDIVLIPLVTRLDDLTHLSRRVA